MFVQPDLNLKFSKTTHREFTLDFTQDEQDRMVRGIIHCPSVSLNWLKLGVADTFSLE